jgi:hypothetical protein
MSEKGKRNSASRLETLAKKQDLLAREMNRKADLKSTTRKEKETLRDVANQTSQNARKIDILAKRRLQ